MNKTQTMKRLLSFLLCIMMVILAIPMGAIGEIHAHAAEIDSALEASLNEAKSYIDGITINSSSNDPETVVKTFKKHFTWDNEKRENSKSYLFDWSYYNGVVFEGLEYVYEVTGESVYKDYVMEYMSSLIASNGTWAKCTNSGYTSKVCAGYNSTHGADCYKTASLLLDAYEMSGDSRYLTMAATLYTDLDTAANSYLLKNAGYNYRHTWASDPSPDLWLDGLYMILPFRAEYAKYIGDTDELDLIVSRMQWVSDNMYNSSKGLFYHAADSASSNSGTYWLRSIGWYAAAIVDVMDSMEGENLEAMKAQLKKLVDGMKAVQNTSNGMWLNNMNASQSSTNPYETSGTALVCYAVMKAVNNGWLDESYADMAILAFNGICNEKLNGSTLTDICFKGAPGSSNSTFYDNEGKGVGPFIMFYAEVLEYVNNSACEHNYAETRVEPDCENEGSVTYTCTLCGECYNETLSALGHNYKVVVTAPDCENGGYTTYTCLNCGDSYVSDETAALGHNYNAVTKEPTCVADGLVIYTCSCGESYSETLSALGHNYKAVVTAPDCENGGYTTYSCINCGDSYVSDETAALGHSYKETVTEATCSKDGKIVYTCACGDNYEEIIPATGKHEYNAVTTEATCSKDGKIVYTCACGDNYEEIIPATGKHEYVAVTTEATCSKDGKIVYTCDCGDTYEEIITAIDHNYKSQVTAPDCINGGYTTHTCLNCGDTYKDSYTEATGHNYKETVIAPTCETNGYTSYVCACGETYTDNETAALGHSYEAKVTAPTCTREGYTAYTCSVCGDAYTSDYVAAKGHSYGSIVKEPTCTEGGYTMSFCSCGVSYNADETEALGHSYEAKVTAATCETAGYTTYTCAACGDTYTDDRVAALGHNYEYTDTDNKRVYTCINCGDSYEEELTPEYSYEKVTAFASGEKYIITLYSGRKYYALSHANNTISATQVTVSNGVVTSEVTENILWDYNGSKLSYTVNGTTRYLYLSSSSWGWGWWGPSYTLSLSTSNSSTVTLSNNKIKVGSRYLRYSGGSITNSSSGTTAYLFEETEG